MSEETSQPQSGDIPPACCDPVLLQTCCGVHMKPGCCGSQAIPQVCACNAGSPPAPRE